MGMTSGFGHNMSRADFNIMAVANVSIFGQTMILLAFQARCRVLMRLSRRTWMKFDDVPSKFCKADALPILLDARRSIKEKSTTKFVLQMGYTNPRKQTLSKSKHVPG